MRMLTRAKLKRGEGKLASFNSDIQIGSCKLEMTYARNEGEKPSMIPEEVMAALHVMKEIVEYLYQRV